MARAVGLVSVVLGLAVGAALAAERWWPKHDVEPYALLGAGLVLVAAGAPSKRERSKEPAERPATGPVLVPQEQRAG